MDNNCDSCDNTRFLDESKKICFESCDSAGSFYGDVSDRTC